MEERSLRITGANTTFFNKITNTLTKMLIPTKIGFNSIKITMKRNSLLKAYENYKKDTENYDSDELEKKYDEAYTTYLETLDRYVMDSIYKKVKNGTASEFEKDALSRYYEVTSLKEKEYMDYKYRKQKYLLELDKESVGITTKDKIQEKYNRFFVEKMDALYKAILKNYSIKLADTTNIYDSSKEWLYTRIFNTLEEYIRKILDLKMKISENSEFKDILDDYNRFQVYIVGKLDVRDIIEKNMILLGISRKLFTHSIPLIVAQQCYEKIIKDARVLVQDTKMAAKREKAYSLLINLIEDYNVRLLSTKVYWESMSERDYYKTFWDKYKEISKLKDVDFDEYIKRKEILFIKNDMRKIRNEKIDYSRIIVYYKRRLVDYGSMKQLKSTPVSYGQYSGCINKENREIA